MKSAVAHRVNAKNFALIATISTIFSMSASVLGANRVLAQSRVTASSTSVPAVGQWAQSTGTDPLMAVVSIARQRVTIFDKSGPIAQSPISTGRPGFDTPQGVFSIIEKKEEHNSNLYDDASMPFMQRITWSGVAFHAGVVPGYPASHGCIRLPASFAERFFEMSRLNMRVVVVPGETAPMSIAHPALFQPKLTADVLVAGKSGGQQSAPKVAGKLTTKDAAAGPDAPMMLGARVPTPLSIDSAPSIPKAETALLTPLEMVNAKKVALNLEAAEAAKAADAAKLIHRAKLADLDKARRTIGAAEFAQRKAEQRLAFFDRQISQARTEDQIVRANIAYLEAEVEVLTASAKAAETRSMIFVRDAEIRSSAEAAKSTEQLRLAAVAAARSADRLAAPISVFVSRRTGKVYIRQARHPVAEYPLTIANPSQPIGTHVFTAIESKDGGRSVNWNVVSVQAPQGGPIAEGEHVDPPAPRRKKGASLETFASPVAPPTQSSQQLGAAALERIQFPPEAMARITPYLQLGSSLVVSDLGPSIETGPGTDFVVLTRGEEAAVEFITNFARENNLKPPKPPKRLE